MNRVGGSRVGVSNVHGSMLMYLLERGFLNAKEVKSCVLMGMDWEGRGGGRAVSHLTMEHLTIQPSQQFFPPPPHPILCNQFLSSCALNIADEVIQ